MYIVVARLESTERILEKKRFSGHSADNESQMSQFDQKKPSAFLSAGFLASLSWDRLVLPRPAVPRGGAVDTRRGLIRSLETT